MILHEAVRKALVFACACIEKRRIEDAKGLGEEFIEVFSGQAPGESNHVALNRYADTVVACLYAVVNPVSLEFFQAGDVPYGKRILNAQNCIFNIFNDFGVFNFADVFIKQSCKVGFHRCLKDFITCSRLTLGDLSASSISRPNAASSKVSVSTFSASKRYNTSSRFLPDFLASSITEKAYSPSSSLASSRVNKYLSGDLARFPEVRGAVRTVTAEVCMTDKIIKF